MDENNDNNSILKLFVKCLPIAIVIAIMLIVIFVIIYFINWYNKKDDKKSHYMPYVSPYSHMENTRDCRILNAYKSRLGSFFDKFKYNNEYFVDANKIANAKMSTVPDHNIPQN